MFIVLLEFSDNRDRAGELLDGHNAWIERGFADGVFLLTGGLQHNRGGGILAHNTALAELEQRVADDPFVANAVVAASIIELAPRRTDDRLAFLDDGMLSIGDA